MSTRNLFYGAAVVGILWVMLVYHMLTLFVRETGLRIPILHELIPPWPSYQLNKMPSGEIEPMTLGEAR